MKRYLLPVLFFLSVLIFLTACTEEAPVSSAGTVDTSVNDTLEEKYIPDGVTLEEDTYIIVSSVTGNAFHFSDGVFEGGNRLVQYSVINSRAQKFEICQNAETSLEGVKEYFIRSDYMGGDLRFNKDTGKVVTNFGNNSPSEAFALEKNEKGDIRFLLSSEGYKKALCISEKEGDINISVKDAEGTANEYFKLIKASEAEKISTFTNPLSSGHAADPFVTYHEGHYYTLTTWGNKIRIYKSTTLKGALNGEYKDVYVQGNEVKGLIWAPELHYYPKTDRWYIYSSGSTRGDEFNTIRMFCLESVTSDPFGDYVFKGFTDKNVLAIDQTVYYDEKSDTLYTAYSQFASEGQVIMLAVMDDPWTISSTRQRVSYPLYIWEKLGGGTGKNPNVNEGPIFLKNGEKLFLIYSASGCWSEHYCLGMLEFTGSEITRDEMMTLKNWKKSSQSVFSAANKVYGVGHCAFFKSPDGTETWMSFHGMPTPTSGEAGRYMYAQRISFDSEGRPVFGTPLPRGIAIPVPSGE